MEAHSKRVEKLTATFQGTVLVVDDVPTNRLLMRRMLKSLGLQVDEMENGKQACEAVAQKKYDLILMDLHMPVMNGVEASKCIREGNRELPIIALTADMTETAWDRCESVGFSGYLTKPIKKTTVVEELSKYLSNTSVVGCQVGGGDLTESKCADDPQMDIEEVDRFVLDPQGAMERMQVSQDLYCQALMETLPWIVSPIRVFGVS